MLSAATHGNSHPSTNNGSGVKLRKPRASRASRSPQPKGDTAAFFTPQRAAPQPNAALEPVTASGKKDLSHLVGRALVPFFLSDGAENTELTAAPDAASWAQPEDGRAVKIRQFVDGYFVDSGSIGKSSADTQYHPNTIAHTNAIICTSTNTNINANTNASKQQRAPNKSAQPSHGHSHSLSHSYSQAVTHGAASPTTPSNPGKHSPPASAPVTPVHATLTHTDTSKPQRFAAPAFSNSPSPLKVPMPRFLSQTKSTARPQTISEEDTNGHAQSTSKPAAHQSFASKLERHANTHRTTTSAVHQLETDTDTDLIALTHDPVTSLPLSLMHLVHANTQPTAQIQSSLPLPLPLLTPGSFTAASRIPPQPQPRLEAPRLLFLRPSSDHGGDEIVVTHLPLDHCANSQALAMQAAVSPGHPSVSAGPSRLLPPAQFASSPPLQLIAPSVVNTHTSTSAFPAPQLLHPGHFMPKPAQSQSPSSHTAAPQPPLRLLSQQRNEDATVVERSLLSLH